MDWFSWLSQTELEPCLVYEYGLLFAQNQVEEEDMSFFNHDFLQSMGIGVAKHRLEILKLAKRERGRAPYVHRLFASLKKTNRRVRTFVHTWLQNQNQQLQPQPGLHVIVPSKLVYRGHAYHKDNSLMAGCLPALAMKRNRMLIASSASRDSKSKNKTQSPARLKSAVTPERCLSYRGTPVHALPHKDNQLIVPANATDIWWASMFHDLNPT